MDSGSPFPASGLLHFGIVVRPETHMLVRSREAWLAVLFEIWRSLYEKSTAEEAAFEEPLEIICGTWLLTCGVGGIAHREWTAKE